MTDIDAAVGRLHVVTAYAEYLIDTNKQQFQRAIKHRNQSISIDGDWKPYKGFHFTANGGDMHLHIDGQDFQIDSGVVSSVEPVQ